MGKQKTKKLLTLLTAGALAVSVTLIAPLTASAATDWVVTESMSISGPVGSPGFAAIDSGLSPAEGGAIEAGDTITVRGDGVVLSNFDKVWASPVAFVAENGATIQFGDDGFYFKITTIGTALAKYERNSSIPYKITLSGEGTVEISGSAAIADVDFEVTGANTNVTLVAEDKIIDKLEVKRGKLTLGSTMVIKELIVDSGAALVIENTVTLDDVVNNGMIAIDDGAEIIVTNAFTNSGTINAEGKFTIFNITNTVSNEGTIDIKANGFVNVGMGTILENNGRILIASDAGGAYPGTLYVSGTLINNDRITNSGNINISMGILYNSGTITNRSSGTVWVGVLNPGELVIHNAGRLTNLGVILVDKGELNLKGTIINGSQTNKTAEINIGEDDVFNMEGAFIFDGGKLENHAIVTVNEEKGLFGFINGSTGNITVYPGSKIVRDDNGDLTNINLRALGFIVTRGSYDNETSGGDNRITNSAADTLITGSAASGVGGGAGGNGNGEIEIFTDEEAAVKAIKEATRGTITISPSLGATPRILAALSEANATVRIWIPHGNHGVMLRSTDINSKSGLKDLNFAGGRVEVPESISSRFPNASSVTGMSFVQNGDFGSVEAVTLSVKLELEPKLWGSKVAVYSVNADGQLTRLPASRIVSGNGMVNVTISNFNSLVFVVE